MANFPINTLESAPEASKPSLQALNEMLGTVPNIAGAMATSPVLIASLVGLFKNVHGGSFSEPQIQVLLLTNAVTNSCEWAVAFHTTLALKQDVDPADVQAIRERRSPRDAQSAALSVLARTLIEKRGHLASAEVAAFLGAGFSESHLLEVIAVVAASAITNYTGNVTHPPLEKEFQPHAWTGK